MDRLLHAFGFGDFVARLLPGVVAIGIGLSLSPTTLVQTINWCEAHPAISVVYVIASGFVVGSVLLGLARACIRRAFGKPLDTKSAVSGLTDIVHSQSSRAAKKSQFIAYVATLVTLRYDIDRSQVSLLDVAAIARVISLRSKLSSYVLRCEAAVQSLAGLAIISMLYAVSAFGKGILLAIEAGSALEFTTFGLIGLGALAVSMLLFRLARDQMSEVLRLIAAICLEQFGRTTPATKEVLERKQYTPNRLHDLLMESKDLS